MNIKVINAQLYLGSVKKIKAAEGCKELQMALVDDHIENGESATEIIQALLDRNKELVDMLPNIKTGLSILEHNPDMMECERNGARKTLAQIEQWENN